MALAGKGARAVIYLDVDDDAAVAGLRNASSQLGRFSRSLAAQDSRTKRATQTSSRFAQTTGRLGGSFASAARSAASLAAAYVGISQAKAAITTTQDLTKATLGLKNNLGLAGKEAGQWAAAARARDVDTTKLGMAFKTLSTQVEGARAGAETSTKLFDDLGISMKEVKAGSTDVGGLMLEVADGMDKAGAGTERTNVASKLFGRSWQGLAPLIRDGSDALKENLKATEKYGSAIHGQTLKDQEKLRGELIESKLAWQGLQVTFTQAVTPALDKLTNRFQKVSAIMADNKLTSDEKWARVAKVVERTADEALDGFIAILPKIAERAGEAAPRIAGALVKGFLNADALGKLAIGTWFLHAMGGWKAVQVMGLTTGRKLGRAVGIGLLLALPTYIEDVGDFINDKIGGALGDDDRIDLTGDTPMLTPEGGKSVSLEDYIKDEEAALERSEGNWRKRERGVGKSAEDTQRKAGAESEKLTDRVGKASEEARRRANRESGKMAKGVAGNVGEMVNAASDGLRTLGKNTSNALSAFEVKKVSFSIEKAAKTVGGLFRATGGRIPGYSTVDDTMVMARGGERFLTPETQFPIADFAMQATFGTGLDSMLRSTGGVGYAKGGHVPHPAMGNVRQFQTGGLNPAISSVAKWAGGRYGATISSGYRPGDPGFHGQGAAVDLVSANMLQMARGIAGQFGPRLAELIHTPLGYSIDNGQRVAPFAQADHYDHVHAAALGGAIAAAVKRLKRLVLTGPKGPLRSMGQSSLDMAWKGANAMIKRQSFKGGDSGSFTGINASSTLALGRKMMLASGWGRGQWPALKELWARESGWNPNAVNPSSGAYGIPQALGHGHPFPLGKAKPQIAWGLDYIRGRYGSPSAALGFHNAHNWYAKGGVVRQPQMHGLQGQARQLAQTQRDREKRLEEAEGERRKELNALLRQGERQAALLQALIEQVKAGQQETREVNRNERQARRAYGPQARRFALDAILGEVGSIVVRRSAYAGNGRVTAIGVP